MSTNTFLYTGAELLCSFQSRMSLPYGNPRVWERVSSFLFMLRNVHPCHLLRDMSIFYRKGGRHTLLYVLGHWNCGRFPCNRNGFNFLPQWPLWIRGAVKEDTLPGEMWPVLSWLGLYESPLNYNVRPVRAGTCPHVHWCLPVPGSAHDTSSAQNNVLLRWAQRQTLP